MSPHFLNPRSLCAEAEHVCRNQPLGVQRKDQTESKGVCYTIISACLCLKFPLTQKFKKLKSINGRGFPVAQMAKNLAAITQIPSLGWIGKIPWRREWPPTPVFLPGEFHGQRSLEGYSPWGHKELDTTEQLTYTHTPHRGPLVVQWLRLHCRGPTFRPWAGN